jgi:hypothetical protein
MNPRKSFLDTVQKLSGRFHIWQIFQDFCELAALTLVQPFYQSSELEKQYLETIGRYKPEEANKFAELLAFVIEGLEEKPGDFLGQAFMDLNLGNHYAGQFFTPDDLSRMISQMTCQEEVELPECGPFMLCEPACGSGGMIIQFALSLQERGINFQQKLHVVCQDVSYVCFCMAYIQLTLLGISAEVCHGNSLSGETWKSWRTMGSINNGYTLKGINADREAFKDRKVAPVILLPPAGPDPLKAKQADLFAF